MYYYTFKDNDIREQVCNSLISYGFIKCKYSCELEDSKGIGTCGYGTDISKCLKYVLLSESMMDKNPRYGWVEPYRTEIKSLEEFLSKCKDLV